MLQNMRVIEGDDGEEAIAIKTEHVTFVLTRIDNTYFANMLTTDGKYLTQCHATKEEIDLGQTIED